MEINSNCIYHSLWINLLLSENLLLAKASLHLGLHSF
jgi:hypothetical protein